VKLHMMSNVQFSEEALNTEGIELSEVAKKCLENDPEEFFKRYGYYYVSSFTYGMSGTITLTKKNVTKENKLNVSGDLKLVYDDPKKLNVDGTAKGEITDSVKEVARTAEISSKFIGLLNDDKSILQISDHQSCKNVLDKLTN
jgi:hypothetical protein